MNDLLKNKITQRATAAYDMSIDAAKVAMDFFGKAKKWNKKDSSPVTEADIAIDKVLQSTIADRFPKDAILSEETEASDSRFEKDFVWIIDPIDGTKEFIRQSNDFCIMIGICYKGEPVYGVTHIPATGEIFYGGEAFGSYMDVNGRTTKLNQQFVDGNKVLTSRSHSVEIVIPYLESRKLDGIPCGSSGVKACRLVDQTAQHYLHGSTIHEWDTASADALVRGAGGYFTTLDGNPIIYNKPTPTVEGVIATFSKKQLLDVRDFFKK